MRSKYFRRILFVTLCLVICFSGAAYASDSIKWYAYEEGMVLGKAEKKKIFLDLAAMEQGHKRKMEDAFVDIGFPEVW